MTNEELDKARAEKAYQTYMGGPAPAEIAARLAREGWMPVDPDLLVAREIVFKHNSEDHLGWAQSVMNGEYDHHREVKTALAAYKAGKASNAR